jgi:peptidoglycan/xylan/chitin deacetylase (PgdA/CDA1 family)
MVRSALFLLLFVATNAALALLYPFSLSRLVLVAVLYALGTGIMLYLLFHPRNQWLMSNRSVVEEPGSVALTFDDGPDPVFTPRLLDLLREKQVQATFFVVGQRAQRHPEIVRRAWEEGHLIGNHTWSHRNLFCFLTPGRLRSEIEAGSDAIQQCRGVRPRYFRSPVGLRHPLLRAALQRAGLEYISWRIRSWDTMIHDPQKLERRILSRVKGGEIILLHDRLPRGAEAMLEMLPELIDKLRERGFNFVLAGAREAEGSIPSQ